MMNVPSAIAETEDEIYDDYVYSGETYQIKGNNFSFFFDDPTEMNDRIFATFPSGRTSSIAENECDYKDQYRICLDYINFSHLDKDTDKHIYKAYVTIFAEIADLEIQRTIDEDDKNLNIGEKARLRLRLDNIGNLEATNTYYEDYFPKDYFNIDEVKTPCQKLDDKVVWEGILNSQADIECDYVIVPKAVTEYKSQAKVTYFTGVEELTEKSDEINFEIDPSIEITYELTPTGESYDVGKNFSLRLILTNLHPDEKDITVNKVYFKTPKEIELLDSSLNMYDDEIYWSDKISYEDKKIFDFVLVGNVTGTHIIEAEAKFNNDGQVTYSTKNIPVTITSKNPEINFNLKEKSVTAGDDLNLIIEIKNEEKNITFQNIELEISSPIIKEPIVKNLNQLGPYANFIIKETIKVPEYSEEETYPIYVNLTHGWYKQRFKTFVEDQITIKPQSMIQQISSDDNQEQTQQSASEKEMDQSEIKEEVVEIKETQKTNHHIWIYFSLNILLIFLIFKVLFKFFKN